MIEGNRIAAHPRRRASRACPIDRRQAAQGARPGDSEIDLAGQYVLPGFVDMHGHIGGAEQGTPGGVRLQALDGPRHHHRPRSRQRQRPGLDASSTRPKSARNEITAPRIEAYVFFGQGREDADRHARGRARSGSARMARAGRGRPQVLRLPARHHGARRSTRRRSRACAPPATTSQMNVARINVLDSARWGLTTHGALVRPARGAVRRTAPSRTTRSTTTTPTSSTASARPAGSGSRRRRRAAERWNEVMDELIELDFTLDPDAHHLRGEPRPDARAPRRVARRVHAALALEVLRSPAARRTAPTGSTGRPRTRSPGRRTTGSG